MQKRNERARRTGDVLFFVEDPGPANFVSPLIGPLQKRGVYAIVAAAGWARLVLQERGIHFESMADMSTEDLLRRFKPRLIVVGSAGNHNPLTAALVRLARRGGVPTVGVVDARMNARERWRGGSRDPLRYAPQWLLVPDQWTAHAFEELGFSSRRIIAAGHPHYDYVRSARRRLSAQGRQAMAANLFPGLAAGQRILTFVTEGSARVRAREGQPAQTYRWPVLPRRLGRVETALAALLLGVKKLADKPYLVLCLHPKDRRGDYMPYTSQFDLVREREPLLELFYASDLVVGLSSMALAEAVLLGCPVLSILPRAEERVWLPPLVAQAARCVSVQAELDEALVALMARRLPSKPVAPVDRGAADRVLDWLQSVRV